MNTEEKILKILFEEPNKEFHIRNLARLTKLNPSTVSYTTEKLAKESILLREKSNDLNTVIVKADTESQKYIVVWKNGSVISQIWTEARIELEQIFEKKVFLALRAKSHKNWRKNESLVKQILN